MREREKGSAGKGVGAIFNSLSATGIHPVPGIFSLPAVRLLSKKGSDPFRTCE